MDVFNQTPFPVVSWESADANRQWHMTSLIRVKYRLVPARDGVWSLRLHPDQGELFGGDQFYDDDPFKPVRYESDFVTYKPHTDVVLNATAYSPGGRPEKHWQCSVEVISPDGKVLNHSRLHVRGERTWHRIPMTGWARGLLHAVAAVPLRYDRAWGGKIPNPDPEAEDQGKPLFVAYNEYNPVGTGITHRKMDKQPFPAHQVTWANRAIKRKKYAAGFGFTHRSWKPRIGYAGTYDQDWLDNQHPYPPHDFDFYHHQAANPELVMQGYIQPHSHIRLTHLFRQAQQVDFRLPELHCFTDVTPLTGEFQRHQMPIDTVLVDIESEEQKDWAVYLSYRTYMPIQSELASLTLRYLPTELLAEQKQQANQSKTTGALPHG